MFGTVIPQIMDSVKLLTSKMNGYITSAQNWFDDVIVTSDWFDVQFINEQLGSWYDLWGSWAFMDEPVMDPAFTTEENEELAELKSEVTDILTTSYDAFIMGQRPVSEWTQVQDQIRESAARTCEIYNTAAAR